MFAHEMYGPTYYGYQWWIKEVKTFIIDFNQAWSNKNFSKVSDCVSDNFLGSGVTKNLILQFFKISASYVSESKLIITGFERHGNIARIEGVRKDKYFEISIPPGSLLIKENGRWKWYGNQIP